MTRQDPTELEQRLGLGVADDRELAYTILHAAGGGSYSSSTHIDYPSREAPALSLHFNKKDEVWRIEAGDALTEELVTRIEQEVAENLLAPAKDAVFQAVLFAPWPTEGYWRYRDKLVIRRAPDDAPRVGMVMGDHPLVLEVRHPGAQDPGVRQERGWKEYRRLGLLLSLFIPGLKMHGVSSRHLWVTPLNRDNPSEMRSIFAQESYFAPGFKGLVEELSPQGSLSEIGRTRTMPTSVGADDVLVIPEALELLLDAFFALDESKQKRLLRAAFWLHHAQDVWHLSKSANYQALVQAVEVLIDTPADQPKCSSCTRPMGAGPTALFRAFLDRYAPMPDSDQEPARKILYRVRSNLSHGSTLLYMDEENDFGWNSPRPIYEMELVRRAALICRTAIVAWLARQGLIGLEGTS